MKCTSSADTLTLPLSYWKNINSVISGITHHRNSQILFTAGRGHAIVCLKLVLEIFIPSLSQGQFYLDPLGLGCAFVLHITC